jgi:hypothetical protein
MYRRWGWLNERKKFEVDLKRVSCRLGCLMCGDKLCCCVWKKKKKTEKQKKKKKKKKTRRRDDNSEMKTFGKAGQSCSGREYSIRGFRGVKRTFPLDPKLFLGSKRVSIPYIVPFFFTSCHDLSFLSHLLRRCSIVPFLL